MVKIENLEYRVRGFQEIPTAVFDCLSLATMKYNFTDVVIIILCLFVTLFRWYKMKKITLLDTLFGPPPYLPCPLNDVLQDGLITLSTNNTGGGGEY